MTEYKTEMQGRCILAAEDNEVNQIVLEHTLNEQELPYKIVADGAQAIEAWRALNPLMIIMDVSMPVMNGLDAIKQIRKEEAATGQHVPIVVLTAHALSGDKKRMLEAGADHYLSKPVNPNTLLAKVMEINNQGPSLAIVR